MAEDLELLRSLPQPTVSCASYSVAAKLALVAHFLRSNGLTTSLGCLEREAPLRLDLGLAHGAGDAVALEQHFGFCLAELQREANATEGGAVPGGASTYEVVAPPAAAPSRAANGVCSRRAFARAAVACSGG